MKQAVCRREDREQRESSLTWIVGKGQRGSHLFWRRDREIPTRSLTRAWANRGLIGGLIGDSHLFPGIIIGGCPWYAHTSRLGWGSTKVRSRTIMGSDSRRMMVTLAS